QLTTGQEHGKTSLDLSTPELGRAVSSPRGEVEKLIDTQMEGVGGLSSSFSEDLLERGPPLSPGPWSSPTQSPQVPRSPPGQHEERKAAAMGATESSVGPEVQDTAVVAANVGGVGGEEAGTGPHGMGEGSGPPLGRMSFAGSGLTCLGEGAGGEEEESAVLAGVARG
ncbi:unnamed protein product, partial [Discosporangium mesarthrocarpum]